MRLRYKCSTNELPLRTHLFDALSLCLLSLLQFSLLLLPQLGCLLLPQSLLQLLLFPLLLCLLLRQFLRSPPCPLCSLLCLLQ